MIACILKLLCEINALLEQKVAQLQEVLQQVTFNCEKLDAINDPDAECADCES